MLPGSIEAVTEAPVLARASGYIRKRLVDIGDRVAAGQVLAEIEAPEIDQQIVQAKAQDDQAASAIQQAQANLVQGQANLQLAEVTKNRWQKLFDKGVVSRQENDTYRAQWAAQQANVDALEKAIAAARSNLGAAQANLARLNDVQSYQTVRAPFAGVITVRNVDTGVLVTEGATLLYRIAQTGRLRTYLNVPQSDADSVRPGQKATLVIPDLAGRKFPGVVTRTANALDPSSRTLLVEVQVNSDGVLLPGMYAQVDLSVPRKEPPLAIPGDTLVVRDNVTQVAVVSGDGTVHFQRIQLGRDLGDRLEVLSGLQPGQLLAVNPSDSVREGVKVKPLRVEKAPVGAGHALRAIGSPMMSKPILGLSLSILMCGGLGVGAPQPPAQDTPPAPQLPGVGRPVRFDDSQRLHDLVRAGGLYLGLQDALALAIENNLDVELERFSIPQGDAELRRAQGGGANRGITYTLQEAPIGVGGPLSPLVVAPATGSGPSGTSVPTNALELGVLGEPVDNYSMQGGVAQSSGTPVPTYDPSVFGQLNWLHQSTLETNPGAYGTSNLVQQGFIANTGIQQGFSTGAQAAFNFDNLHQSSNAANNAYNPISGASLGFTVTQPLLRGFGRGLNRRFIRIAGNERKITSLLFQQQLINTVYGVIRLYTDFVALYEDVNVKEETLRSASKLLADTQAQVEEGTLAPVELTRAKAQVFSTDRT